MNCARSTTFRLSAAVQIAPAIGAAPTLALMIAEPPTKTVATAIVTANLCIMIFLSSIDHDFIMRAKCLVTLMQINYVLCRTLRHDLSISNASFRGA